MIDYDNFQVRVLTKVMSELKDKTFQPKLYVLTGNFRRKALPLPQILFS